MHLAIIPAPPFDAVALGPLTIRLYAVFVTIGMACAVTLGYRLYLRRGDDRPDMIRRAAWIMSAAGLVGARAGYVATHGDEFARRPWEAAFIWHGGLAIFGGVLFGALAGIAYLRAHNGRVPDAADAAGVVLPLAQGIGRWGNYFNQELYGRPTELPWGLQVEGAYRLSGFESYGTFHPAFLYESIWDLALFVVLFAAFRRGALRGRLFFVYLAAYGVGRFAIELIRIDTTYRLAGLSRNAWVSLIAIAIALVGAVITFRRGHGLPAER